MFVEISLSTALEMDALCHMLVLPSFYFFFFFFMQKDKFPPNHNQGIVQHVHMKRDENVKNGKYF